jgi:hypothetical protein
LLLVWLGVKQRFPFTIDAICLLPNHIHSDSVKHELVKQANLWPWFSLHRYVREGFYESDWGSGYTDGSSNLFGE